MNTRKIQYVATKSHAEIRRASGYWVIVPLATRSVKH